MNTEKPIFLTKYEREVKFLSVLNSFSNLVYNQSGKVVQIYITSEQFSDVAEFKLTVTTNKDLEVSKVIIREKEAISLKFLSACFPLKMLIK